MRRTPKRKLLLACESGDLQLPDFQRSWVWAEDRILSLIASISRAFPVGALMKLESAAGAATIFARRPIEGTPAAAASVEPGQLLLDGQQRMTSLYQTCMRQSVVQTITPTRMLVRRWFYIDIQKALESDADREEAIFTVPEDRKIKTNFDKDIRLDLSTREAEFEHLMFPVNQIFDWDAWQEEFGDYWIAKGQPERRQTFKDFKNQVLQNFKSYQVPVIALDHTDDKRKNIPTAEFQSVAKHADQTPVRVKYPRNTDLDPQLVWRGKDEQDWSDLVVHAPPLYIQEKVQPVTPAED